MSQYAGARATFDAKWVTQLVTHLLDLYRACNNKSEFQNIIDCISINYLASSFN